MRKRRGRFDVWERAKESLAFWEEMRKGLRFGKGREGKAALMFGGEEMQVCCLGKMTNRFSVCRR